MKQGPSLRRKNVPLEQIDSAPFQIRQSIDEERLRALASSMDVRPKGERFEVTAGECRLRAAKLLQCSTIACRVFERSDLDAEIDKIVESGQRTDPKPLDRARMPRRRAQKRREPFARAAQAAC